MNKIKRIFASVLSVATLLSVAACGDSSSSGNNAPTEWTVETVYAKAKELGFEGTWEDFKAEMRGLQGVGIKGVTVNDDGDLIVTLTDETEINCGSVRGSVSECKHTYGNYKTGAAATCESIGYKTRTCSKCGNVEYSFQEAKGHSWTTSAALPEELNVCSICGVIKLAGSTQTPDDGNDENEDDNGNEDNSTIDKTKSQLYISVFNGGYGNAWMVEAAKRFEAQYADVCFADGKKGVQVVVEANKQNASELFDQIPYRKNQIFLTNATQEQMLYAVQSGLVKDLSSVMSQPLTALGDTKTIKEKLPDGSFTGNTLDGKDYFLPYLADNWGIFYNRSLFSKYDLKVPNTTNEMFNLFNVMKTVAVSPMIFSGRYAQYYTEWLLNVWWAQYEGAAGYENFWKGEVNGQKSKEVLRQQGRLEALTAYHQLFTEDTYFDYHSFSATTTHLDAQNYFLLSELNTNMNKIGMLFDGEWLMSEAEYTLKEIENVYGAGSTPDIGMMRTPVLSSIVNTLDDKTMTDQTLSAVIEAIDSGATSYQDVSASDFDKIKAARNVVSTTYHQFCINANAQGEDLAVAEAFLQFMSCDQALSEVAAFGLRSNLCSTISQDAYERMNSVKKDAYQIAKTSVPLPDPTGYRLYQAGLRAFRTGAYSNVWEAFRNGQMTAQQYFDGVYSYYGSKFDTMVNETYGG